MPKYAAVVVVVAVFVAAGAQAATAGPCAALAAAHLAVSAGEHRIYLCSAAGAAERSYVVRLARDGVGKTREGDDKMPLGTYPLGKPRRSRQYGTFIPIGYPTAEQQRRGYTGGSVGVHGPDRRVRWLGRLVNTLDTTSGCVGLASDREMDEISAWLRRSGAARIVLSAAQQPLAATGERP